MWQIISYPPRLADAITTPSNISYVIGLLAGGHGQRLGYVEKATQTLNGKTWLATVLAQLHSASISATATYVSANYQQTQDLAAALGLQWVTDKQTDAGPLAGILSLLQQCQLVNIDWLLLAPCDAVLLPNQYAQTLLEHSQLGSSNALVACHNGQLEPLCTLLHRSLLPNLQEHWQNGGRSPMRWLQQLPHATVDFSDTKDTKAIWSVNTPEELVAAERAFAERAFAQMMPAK